ncbi:MAG: alpha-1,4-glucan--maltose-1-phosphate maltosyltransferase, partial [Solirubrobacteraceae bacterium]
LLEAVAAINHARHAHPALQRLDNLTFLDTANEQLIAYLKRDGADVIICVVNLDPHNAQQGLVTIGPELGLANELPVRDLLTGERWQWRTGGNYVGLAPGVRQAHVLAVQRPEAERA